MIVSSDKTEREKQGKKIPKNIRAGEDVWTGQDSEAEWEA